MSNRYGWEGLLYQGTAGTEITPSTSNIVDAIEVTINFDDKVSETPTRAGGGWNSSSKGLRDLSVTVRCYHDPEDTNYSALLTAAKSASGLIALRIIDHSGTGGKGVDADFVLTCEHSQPIDGRQTVSFTGKLNTDTRTPTAVTNT